MAVTSTINEAEMLANDLRIWLTEDEVETFPAWETLPFERVSPTTATMGKRLELINKIQEGRAPKVIVSPIRALLQRINPEARDIQPLKFERGAEADLSELADALVLQGYRHANSKSKAEVNSRFAVEFSMSSPNKCISNQIGPLG